jgi:cold shock CspA family protein
MPEGKIKWINPDRGYGSILTPDYQELFMYDPEMNDSNSYKEGDVVIFDLVKGKNGFRAENIKLKQY